MVLLYYLSIKWLSIVWVIEQKPQKWTEVLVATLRSSIAFIRTGEMTSEGGGGTRLQGDQGDPSKTEKSLDLTKHFPQRAQFNKMIKIFSKIKYFWKSMGRERGHHAMNLCIKYLITTDATQKIKKWTSVKRIHFLYFTGHPGPHPGTDIYAVRGDSLLAPRFFQPWHSSELLISTPTDFFLHPHVRPKKGNPKSLSEYNNKSSR